jgi:hypothetical protein
MRMLPVKRQYAFENGDVPHGEQYVLKVRGWGWCLPLGRVLVVAARRRRGGGAAPAPGGPAGWRGLHRLLNAGWLQHRHASSARQQPAPTAG